MIFDGMRFTHARSVIHLSGMGEPEVAELRKELGREASKYDGYCFFARVLPVRRTRIMRENGDEPPKGYFKTGRSWSNTPGNLPVYARLVQPEGWSLTNMMYGKDGYTYLCLSGTNYVRGGGDG